LRWCPYRNEHIITHDTFQNIVATIALESGTHVQREVSHLFLCHTQQQMENKKPKTVSEP